MDFWEQLKEHTQARIGLHRIGHAISTSDLLAYQMDHALARDAVHETWNVAHFEKALKALGEKPLRAETKVSIREQYLKFPTLGRVLNSASRTKLTNYHRRHRVDIVFIITDGLSTRAIDTHAIPFWKALKPQLISRMGDLKIALVLAPYGRVALSDDIGKVLGAKMSVILVGERPGLSSVNSLGIYLTYAPKLKNSDAQRNCISNVHPPEGLSYGEAVEKLLFLMSESLRLKCSGVAIKEQVGHAADDLHSRLGLGM